jgi:hypothetical protein
MVTNNHHNIDIFTEGSIDDSIVKSSITETTVVDPAPPVAESENKFFDDDDQISMWLEEQGVHGNQKIQGLQDRGV